MSFRRQVSLILLAGTLIQSVSACEDAIVGRMNGTALSGGAQTNTGGAGGAQTSTIQTVCAAGVPVTIAQETCSSGPVLGDVDCNGAIDSVDALKVARRAKQVETATLFEEAGDLNCDGCLTEEDATRISECYVGLLASCTCPATEDP